MFPICSMDEWTEFDVADPRYGTWDRCWPIENPVGPNEGRFGKLPCPNVTWLLRTTFHVQSRFLKSP